ncbi:MAG: hypothetical protein AAF282_00950 [Cyanobacteria bacterium P01_A01_bin.15]
MTPQHGVQQFILNNKVPVPCGDEDTWRAFMRCKENVLLANDTIGQFRVMTVFLGFNYGNNENPKFFQTTCFGTSTEGKPKYSGTWQRACLEHRGKIACAQGLTKFAAERAAGIDRSFRAIDCVLVPDAGEIQFILESESEAMRVMPTNHKHWERRGRMIVFLVHPRK